MCCNVSIFAKKFGIGQLSFIGPSSGKNWYSVEENSPQRILETYRGQDAVGIRRKRMSTFPCKNSIVQGEVQKQRTRQTVYIFCCQEYLTNTGKFHAIWLRQKRQQQHEQSD